MINRKQFLEQRMQTGFERHTSGNNSLTLNYPLANGLKSLKFTGNQSTSNNTVPEYVGLTHIQTDGSAYVDTNFVANAYTKLVYQFQVSEGVEYQQVAGLCGVIEEDVNSRFGVVANNSSITGSNQLYAGICHTFNEEGTPAFDNEVHTFEIYQDETSQHFIADGVELTADSYVDAANAITHSLYIGKCNDLRETPCAGLSHKIIRVEIASRESFEDEFTLIHEFVPARHNSTAEIGLYDIVNRTFYSSDFESGEETDASWGSSSVTSHSYAANGGVLTATVKSGSVSKSLNIPAPGNLVAGSNDIMTLRENVIVDFENKECMYAHRYNTVTFDGTENWQYDDAYNRYYIALSDAAACEKNNGKPAWSNLFTLAPQYGTVSGTYCFVITSGRLYVRTNGKQSLSEFKWYLRRMAFFNHKLTVTYALADEVVEDVTSKFNFNVTLPQYKNVTISTSNCFSSEATYRSSLLS